MMTLPNMAALSLVAFLLGVFISPVMNFVTCSPPAHSQYGVSFTASSLH